MVLVGVAPFLIMSSRLDGPRIKPRSIWKDVPGMNTSRSDALWRFAFLSLALSQNGHLTVGLTRGRVGMHSTHCCVL